MQADYAEEIRAQVGWTPEPGRFHLFWVDVDDVAVVRYDDTCGDQFVTRWPENVEFVRRGTSATTVGEPEPYTDLLVAAASQSDAKGD